MNRNASSFSVVFSPHTAAAPTFDAFDAFDAFDVFDVVDDFDAFEDLFCE
jgi:hypothetical protein